MPATKITTAILSQRIAAQQTTLDKYAEQIGSLEAVVTGLVKDIDELLKMRDYLRTRLFKNSSTTTPAPQPKPQAKKTAKTAGKSAIKTVTRRVQPQNGKAPLTSMAQYLVYKEAIKQEAIATKKPVTVISYSVAQNMAYDRLMATLSR